MAQNLSDFDLTRFDEAFRAARRARDAHGADLADGIYAAEIARVELRRAPGTFTPVLEWRLEVETGEGERVPVRRTLCVTANTMRWVKDDLAKCGLVLERLADLPQRLGEMTGRGIVLQKTSRDGLTRLYFRWAEQKVAGAG